MSWDELLGAAVRDRTNPPLFYALLKVWTELGGESVAWMRLLPCIAGIVAAIPLVALARRVFEPLEPAESSRPMIAAVVAIAAAASSPLLVFLSNELRGYSLLLLMAATSLWAFVRFAGRRPASDAEYRRRLISLTAINVTLVYTHYFGWLLVAAELGAALFWYRSAIRPFVRSVAGTAIAFAPWAAAVLANASGVARPLANVSWISDASPGAIPEFYDALVSRILTPGTAWIGAIAMVVPLVVLAVAAAFGGGSSPLRKQVLQLAWFAAFPVLAVYAVGLAIGRSAFVPRYLVVAAPAWWLIVGLAVARLSGAAASRHLQVRVAATACAFILAAGTLRMVRGGEKIAWDHLVGAIAADAGPRAGTVYTLEGFTALPLAYYARTLGINVSVERFGTDPAFLGPAWLVERSNASGAFRPPDRPLLGWRLGLSEIETQRTPSHAIRVYRIDPR